MHESNLSGAEKAQEFQFIIDTADHLEAANGKFFNKLANRDKDGDPNTIDKDDLKEALKLDDRKREYGRGFLTDTERKSVSYLLKHWDEEKLKVIKDDILSYDSHGQEFRHQGFADITRQSLERAVAFYARPLQSADTGSSHSQRPPAEHQHAVPQANNRAEREAVCAPKHNEPAPKVSEAEILKNTQDYLSGKNLPSKEDKRYFSHYDAAEMEQRRRAEFALSSQNNTESFHPQRLATDPQSFAQPEMVEPKYTFRDGVNNTLGILGSLTRAAEPFLMWDLAKEHARNQNGAYRRANHNDTYYGPSPYLHVRPIVPAPSPWLYARPVQPPHYRGYSNPGYGGYGPGYGGYNPGYGGYNPRYGGNYYQHDSDTNFMHAGPDGLTFSRSQQRVPRAVPPPSYYPPRGGNYGYSDYSSGNGINDTLDLFNGLTGAAMPWLQWDLAKQYARNQRELYRNRR